jgi:hypothetical protein
MRQNKKYQNFLRIAEMSSKYNKKTVDTEQGISTTVA